MASIHPYFYQGAFAMAFLPSIFGLNAVLRPEAAMRSVQFPVPADPEARKLSRGLMRIYGSRNIAITYLILLAHRTGDRKLTGLSLAVGVYMALVDGFVSRSVIGGGEWSHWGFIPVVGSVVAGLLGVFN